MTDNEIIKALECFAIDKDFDETHCIGCAFEHQFCTANMSEDIAIPALALVNRQKAEIERLQELLDSKCDRCIERAKAEAIKEFAERLKEYREIVSYDRDFDAYVYGSHIHIDIDEFENLVKEIAGEQ